MAFKKITESDLYGKGVIGQPDVPGLEPRELQEKMEEIVRDVVIPAMNENIEEAEKTFATKAELEQTELESGSVISVFGRGGRVLPQEGDYTPEMVGAAKEKHAAEHYPGGSDPFDFPAAGVAMAEHSHGNISSDGKIGITQGLVIMTGTGGKLEAKSKASSGFELAPEVISASSSANITLLDNKEYNFTNITSLNLSGGEIDAHGFVAFGSTAPSITVSGFNGAGGDDITSAKANETWEFSVCKGYIIWKNWSA
ncbi:MAG: hypothetical protein IKU42_00435 [Oscillospiraceae bacterium]|nr:hypothetical protein [Oscillospiraceae bacterium]